MLFQVILLFFASLPCLRTPGTRGGALGLEVGSQSVDAEGNTPDYAMIFQRSRPVSGGFKYALVHLLVRAEAGEPHETFALLTESNSGGDDDLAFFEHDVEHLPTGGAGVDPQVGRVSEKKPTRNRAGSVPVVDPDLFLGFFFQRRRSTSSRLRPRVQRAASRNWPYSTAQAPAGAREGGSGIDYDQDE